MDNTSVADPDLELRGGGGGGLDVLALLARFPSVISSFFTQNKGGQAPQAPPLDPPLHLIQHRVIHIHKVLYSMFLFSFWP